MYNYYLSPHHFSISSTFIPDEKHCLLTPLERLPHPAMYFRSFLEKQTEKKGTHLSPVLLVFHVINRGPSGPSSGAGSGTGALPGQGNHLLNRRTRGAGGGPSMDEEGEFDFQAGLAKFDKEKVCGLKCK